MTTVEWPTRILRVDLTTAHVESEPIPERWLRRYIGGKGLGARYLYAELDPGIDPLGPDNRLCLLRGPVSGYLPGEPRFAAITKSPLTGIFVDSYSGGGFAEAFIAGLAEHMGIIVEGRADAPVELYLADGDLSIRSAEDRWGLDTAELAEAIDDGAVAGIGPAGESLVRYATIATDGGDHHAGRGGTGAVMGSKRLKAIVASGSLSPDATMEALRRRYEARFDDHPHGRWHRSSGTVETVDAADAAGVLPTRGWTEGRFEQRDGIGIDALRAAGADRENASAGIPGDFNLDGVVARGGLSIALGSNLGIGDIDSVIDLGRACDTLGLDLIEAGNALAWAILASEHGIIDQSIGFDDPAGAAELLGEIAERSSELGDRLAEGIDRATTALGGDELVPTVKSMSAASYDPRPAPAMALAFATSDRGACHRRSRPVFEEVLDATEWSIDDRVEAVIEEQDRRSLLWCFIVDDITAPAFEDDLGVAYLDALGWSLETDELATIGERVWTLTRLFNVREGVTAEDDRLPATFERSLETDSAGSRSIDAPAFGRLKQRYYDHRGWDRNGHPTAGLLKRLDLTDVAHPETSSSHR